MVEEFDARQDLHLTRLVLIAVGAIAAGLALEWALRYGRRWASEHEHEWLSAIFNAFTWQPILWAIILGVVKSSNTSLIFTNQLRQKIGVMFGNPETTTGGMALKFYASIRMDVRRIQSIKQGNDVVGNRTRVTVRIATCQHKCEHDTRR